MEKITLHNGARLLLIPDKAKQVSTTLVLFGVGSRYESEKEAGISHVLEHMYFKGSKKRPTALELAEFVEEIGGENNAFTGKEYTGYYVKAAGQYLEKAFDYLSDMLLNPLFDAKELEQEKNVVLQEMDMYEDLPMEVAANKFELALFGKNALGRDVIGYRKSILVLTRDDLIEYKNKYYAGCNTVIAVAGNFGGKTSNKVKEMVERYFSFGSKETAKYQPVILPAGKTYSLIKRKTEQSHIVVGFPGVPFTDDDRYKLNVLALVLGGSMSSRMFMEIREKRGLAYAVRTSTSNYHDAGVIDTYAGVPHSRVDEAIEAIINEYKKVKEGVSEQELIKAKQIIFGKRLIAFEDASEIASHYAMSELMTKKVLSPEELLEIYSKITVKDLVDVANKYLDIDKITISFVGKELTEDKLEKLITDK